MRVMLLAPGLDVHTNRFLTWLEKAGCEVIFVDKVKPKNLDPSCSRFVKYPSGLPGTGRRLARLDDWARYLHLHYLWRRFRPDVVNLHNVCDERQYDCLRARLRPLILSCWGADINRLFVPGADPLSRICTGRVLRFADHVFADAMDVLENCRVLAGRPVPSSLLYFGINTDLFRPDYTEAAKAWRHALAIPQNARVLLSVRAWRWLYRHELILEAFALARARLPFPTVLVFKRYNPLPTPGEDKVYEEDIRVKAQSLGVQNCVRWLDRVPYDQMPAIYSLADLVVNFPCRDGFPVSFIEAAACGKRVVTNHLPAYEGVGLENFFGMVPNHSTEQLGRAIAEALMEQPESVSAKAQLARQWAVTYGDEKKCIEQLLTVYGRVAKRYNRGNSRKGAASSCLRS